MFGSPSYLSKVTFSDSIPVRRDGGWNFSVGIKPGIAISRKTGSVRRGAFFRVEFVEPGSVFTFIMSAMNLPNYLLGILANVILDMNSGYVKVGGFKTRGFGRVEIRNLSYEVVGFGGLIENGQGPQEKVLKGFNEEGKPWYDPMDESVSFDGSPVGLLSALSQLARKKLTKEERRG